MQINRIRGATRVLGKSQGYLGLPVRDEMVIDKTIGEIVPAMVTAWEPSPAELAMLADGASVYVRIFGMNHPPILVYVEPKEPEDS